MLLLPELLTHETEGAPVPFVVLLATGVVAKCVDFFIIPEVAVVAELAGSEFSAMAWLPALPVVRLSGGVTYPAWWRSCWCCVVDVTGGLQTGGKGAKSMAAARIEEWEGEEEEHISL